MDGNSTPVSVSQKQRKWPACPCRFEATNPFSSFHKVVERGRCPLNGVNVPLHSVLQRRALSTLQLHVTVTGNKECYDCYNLSVYNTKYLNAAEKLTE